MSSSLLPLCKVGIYAIQHGLRIWEEVDQGLEHGGAHDVEEAQLGAGHTPLQGPVHQGAHWQAHRLLLVPLQLDSLSSPHTSADFCCAELAHCFMLLGTGMKKACNRQLQSLPSQWVITVADLAEELFLKLVGPALVRLGLGCQVADVRTLQHHLHSTQTCDVWHSNLQSSISVLPQSYPAVNTYNGTRSQGAIVRCYRLLIVATYITHSSAVLMEAADC